MSEEQPPIASDRLSIDTLANINEDVSWASEVSGHSRPQMSESVFSSLRQSLDMNSNHVGAFNILKQFNGPEDDRILAEGSPLGPNSIFDLTAGLDQARIRLNKGLKPMVLVNGGANKVYNLIKPSTREIPPIQLEPLQKKISKADLFTKLVDNISTDYKAFELSYKTLTTDTLSKLSQQYEEQLENEKEMNTSGSFEELESLKIPEVFETPEFHLEDQRVFRQVMETSSIFPENSDSQEFQLVHNSKVQESLSHYLDYIEVHIVEEISQTADSFFATLDDIEEIKADSQTCIDAYNNLLSSLTSMQEKQANVGTELMNLIDQHRNVQHLESSVFQIDAILKAFSNALNLVNDGKNIDCLNQILVIESLVHGVSKEQHSDSESLALYPKFEYPLVDLSNLGALKNKQKSIEALKSTCCRGYIDEFMQLLLQDLKLHLGSVTSEEAINRIYLSTLRLPRKNDIGAPSYLTIDPNFRERVAEFIQNLAKSGYLALAFAQYQDLIIKEVKSIIRTRLPTSKSEGVQMDVLGSGSELRSHSVAPEYNANSFVEPNSVAGPTTNGSLTNSIKAMSDQEFLDMMRDIYANLSECMRRLTVHQKFLLDISLTSIPKEMSQNFDVMSLDISNSIYKAIELTQVRLTKVLNVRLEPLGDAPLKNYLQVFLLTSGYLQECESINPGYNATEQGSSLNEWIRNHLSYFCHRTHTSALKRLVNLCEKDTWKEYTGSRLLSSQKELNEAVDYAAFLESASGFDGSKWVDTYLDFLKFDKTDEEETEGTEGAISLSQLKIKTELFFVPSFMPVVILAIRDYIIFSRIFNSKARTAIQNLLTYLKVLNSRISLAILSAGATKTAGLKHITTRHLALCLQTVEFLLAFLKLTRQIFISLSINPTPNSEPEEQTYELVTKNYEDHAQALISKVVSIMHDRTLNHCTSILKLNLSQPLDLSKQCHQYMEVLVRETQTVANVLGKYIADNELTLILLQIFDNYKKILVNCFCSDLPQLKDFNEKHSLLKDIDYFRVKLDELPGYGNSGQVIWENVNSLPTIEDSKMEEVMRNNIEGERAAAKSARASLETQNTQVEDSGEQKEVTQEEELKKDDEVEKEQEVKKEVEGEKKKEEEEEEEDEKTEKEEMKEEEETEEKDENKEVGGALVDKELEVSASTSNPLNTPMPHDRALEGSRDEGSKESSFEESDNVAAQEHNEKNFVEQKPLLLKEDEITDADIVVEQTVNLPPAPSVRDDAKSDEASTIKGMPEET